MTSLNPLKNPTERFRFRHSTAAWFAAVLLTVAGHPVSSCPAQESSADEPGAQVLTRGPVHEAFAEVISYDSVPGVVVTAKPPALIEEIPPGERPEGDDVTWIPGYWAWDDERNDFLWISGIWRAMPPGREWITGYWAETTESYQWTSGYWADVTTTEITYLPAPPQSVEEGPNIGAPSRNHTWTPGCWIWSEERYAWSPGYWAEGRADWDWIPAHYVWTRRGYVFVNGYWDHSVERRGVLFAPVYFDRGVYDRPGYSYSPNIAIDLGLFAAHLFLRPRYDHYYFGDYYEPRYRESGYYSCHSYQSSRRGYDPIYAHRRWEHRDDRDWERGIERDYQHRRDDESARPPRTWAAQRLMDGGKGDGRRNRSMLATSFDQMSKRKDSSIRYQSVDSDDRKQLARRGQEVQKSREQRRDLETKEADGLREGGKTKANKVPSSRSPIATKPSKDKKGAGSPPEPQRAPKPEQKSPSKTNPKGKPQQEKERERPSMNDKGRDKKADEPQAPKAKPQPERERPSTNDKGRDKKPDEPQAPKAKPQPERERPSTGDKGRDKKPDEPQTPKAKPQPERERPSTNDKGRDKKADQPQAPKSRPQPEPGQPSTGDKGKDKKDNEEAKGKKKKKVEG